MGPMLASRTLLVIELIYPYWENVTIVTIFFIFICSAQSRLPCLCRAYKNEENCFHSNIYEIIDFHDDVIKWKHFPCYWPFVQGIHRSPVNSPHKGQWRGALMFSLICAWINAWVNNREAGDLRSHRAHYGVIVMSLEGVGMVVGVVWWVIAVHDRRRTTEQNPLQKISMMHGKYPQINNFFISF